jgi:hypothetical protein
MTYWMYMGCSPKRQPIWPSICEISRPMHMAAMEAGGWTKVQSHIASWERVEVVYKVSSSSAPK